MLKATAIVCKNSSPRCTNPSLRRCQKCADGECQSLSCSEILTMSQQIKHIEKSNFTIDKFFALTPMASQVFPSTQEYVDWLNLPLDIHGGDSLMSLINNEDIAGVIIAQGLLKQYLIDGRA